MIDVTEHLNLAYKVTWSIYPKVHKKYEFEDLLQIAYIRLVKAGKRFDETKGIQFSTYAFSAMKYELIRFITDDKRFNSKRGIQHNFMFCSYEAERENGSLESRIGSESFEDDFINVTAISQAISKLSDREKKVLKFHLINDLTQKEAAKLCGINQNQVSRDKKRIINKLRSSLEINVGEKVNI